MLMMMSPIQDVHQRMHLWRKEKEGRGDPLPDVARSIADESVLLCFDEFQVGEGLSAASHTIICLMMRPWLPVGECVSA